MVKEGLAEVKADIEARDLAAFREAERKRLETANRYVIKSATQIYEEDVPEPIEIWGGITLTNDLTEIVGMSGVGKSRIMLQLALTQVLGNPDGFAGLPVYNKPLKWLLLGTENNKHRYHSELHRMMATCTAEQKETINQHVFLNTLEGNDDAYMSLNDKNNFAKLRDSIAWIEPDIVVFDPWGDICMGSELDDTSVRETIGALRQMRPAWQKTMALIVVNHSRMGANENWKAAGLDAANFGKNSKVLYTISRCVWNLMIASEDIDSGRVGMINAKRSNGRVYPMRAVQLNDEYLTYDYLEDFDLDAFIKAEQAKAGGPAQNKSENRAAKAQEATEIGKAEIKKQLETGKKSTDELLLALGNAGVTDRKANSLLSESVLRSLGYTSYKKHGQGGETMVGTEAEIAEVRKADEDAIAKEQADEEAAKRALRDQRAQERADRKAAQVAAENADIPKRGRGRPKGSKNKK